MLRRLPRRLTTSGECRVAGRFRLWFATEGMDRCFDRPAIFQGKRMSVVKIYVVKYLQPAEAMVAAVSAKAAVDVFLARRDTPKGAVIQGAYWAHNDTICMAERRK